MLGVTWVAALLARRRARVVGTAAGVAVAVALLAAIGSFLAASKATMTARAAATVSVDWQVEAQPNADPNAVVAATRAEPGVRVALPVGFAATTGLQARTGGSVQTTGPGVVLGVPPGYASSFPGAIRPLIGARDGVLLAQQTASNLHAAPGDTISIGRAGLAPLELRVDGVVDLPQADSLFQKIGAPAGSGPQAPPDNVVLVPEARWHEAFDPLAAARPDLVHVQAHARLSRSIPTDPAAAYARVTRMAHHLEVRLAGAGLVGDNLGATLAAARSDALYAQVLFVFLGLPGAALAAVLTVAVAASGATRRRRDQALLRARGATARQLFGLGVAEAVTIGVIGAASGLVAAAVVGRVAFGHAGFGASTAAALAWTALAGGTGVVIALVAIAVPAWRDARSLTVAAARREVGAVRSPRWARLGLDLVLLAGSGVVFWLTSRNGYQLVLAPEGTPSISVSYWAFAGPLLLWVGAGLLTWRVAEAVLGRARGAVGRLVRPVAGTLSGTVAASMSRQRRLLARSAVLVGLTISFAVSTAVFNATYRHQAEADARLTNGGDVTVTEPPGAGVGPGAAAQLARVGGVRSVEPLQHRFAYVGADLQDLYGVRPATIGAAGGLQDAYFQGTTAREAMARLASRPDGVLVSAETARDFQLRPGDTLRLRLQDARTRQLVEVPFRFVGVVKEFPTAPKDSFLVARADYVAGTTGSDAVGAFLVDTGSASPAAVARRIRPLAGVGAQVTDIAHTRRVVGSSLTAVDLAGLTRVELGFALVLAAAATGLMLALGTAERRRTFAIASALGARSRHLAGFVWGEAGFVVAGGALAGAASGWALSEMLVKVLTGVFDPPPAALAVPWRYLAWVAAAGTAAVVVAAVGALAHARRPALEALRDL